MILVINIENFYEIIFVKFYNNNFFYLVEMIIFKDSLCLLFIYVY